MKAEVLEKADGCLDLMKKAWRSLRQLTGEDAYERYLAHWQSKHTQEGGQALSRKAFFKQELERKWNGVRRCC